MSNASDPLERLRRGFGAEPWLWLRERMRSQLERGKELSSTYSLKDPSAEERRAHNALLGTPGKSGPIQLRLDRLQTALQLAGWEGDLPQLLELCDGPIDQLHQHRQLRRQAWCELEAQARARFPEAHSRLDQMSAQGLWRRITEDNPDLALTWLDQVDRVRQALRHRPATSLPHLAAWVSGDAHALDRGRPLERLCLKLLGPELDVDDVMAWRAAWETIGARVPNTTGPVLVHGLLWEPVGRGTAWNHMTELGEPQRWTARALAKAPAPALHGPVFLCENPSVLEAAADQLGHHCHAIICTEGQPGAAVHLLLQKLTATKAQLLYHGDFDWAGITIANGLMNTYPDLQPWRYQSKDLHQYGHLPGPQLQGQPQAASWDPHLQTTLSQRGHALHEESVIDDLLQDLQLPSPPAARFS